MLSIGICTDLYSLPDVASLGFDYVELPLDALAALTEGEFIELCKYVNAAGIRVDACNRMLPEDLTITGARVSATALHGYLAHALKRARLLGVKIVVLDSPRARAVPDGLDVPFAWRQLGNFLRLAQGHAKESGVTLAIEPIRKAECDLMNLVGEATLIAGLLQLDNVAVAAHSGHMAMASEPVSALRRAGRLLRHVHLENALTRALPMPGDGEDYRRLFRALGDIGYAGGVSVCGAITDAFADDAARSLQYIRQLAESL